MIQLRPARSTDAGRLGAILSDFTDDTHWLPRIHSRAQDLAHMDDMIERGWVTVAQTAQNTAGFLARDAQMIHALYLCAKARNQGIGKALLDHAKSHQPNLELWTFQANTGAQRFYKREGFVEITRTAGHSNDEQLPDIRYTWHHNPKGKIA